MSSRAGKVGHSRFALIPMTLSLLFILYSGLAAALALSRLGQGERAPDAALAGLIWPAELLRSSIETGVALILDADEPG